METIYTATNSSVKIIGTRAAVWTPKSEFFGRHEVTLYSNVEMHEGIMKDGTCMGRKTFKTDAGAVRYSNSHLRAA